MSNPLERIASPLRAAELLDAGKLVAFPTETVYGLGVDATNPAAVERLFAVKGRPGNNPLIVHIAAIEQLDSVAIDLPPLAVELLERFAPGPLTVVVPKHPAIVPAVTAGLNTVGVRIPDHPQALEMLRACRCPIAAPSANRSGKPSATNLASVIEDFEFQIDGVLVAPPSRIGLESTVVDCLSDPPRVLRPGAISLAELQRVVPTMTLAGAAHSPVTIPPADCILTIDHEPKCICLTTLPNSSPTGCRLTWPPQPMLRPATGVGMWFLKMSTRSRLHFMNALREADRRGCEFIYCQQVSQQGTGAALMDRMQRAAER